MKKLLSFILSIAVLLSVVGVSAVTTSATTISPDSSLLTDTSDFDEGLSSIAFSEKMKRVIILVMFLKQLNFETIIHVLR